MAHPEIRNDVKDFVPNMNIDQMVRDIELAACNSIYQFMWFLNHPKTPPQKLIPIRGNGLEKSRRDSCVVRQVGARPYFTVLCAKWS